MLIKVDMAPVFFRQEKYIDNLCLGTSQLIWDRDYTKYVAALICSPAQLYTSFWKLTASYKSPDLWESLFGTFDMHMSVATVSWEKVWSLYTAIKEFAVSRV